MTDTGLDAPTTGYVRRVVDAEIESALRALPAVVLDGPRACGKTSTGREHARSEVLFAGNAGARIAADVDPVGLLTGPEPRLLDEWQLAPEIWNQMRAAADDGRRPGRFILTGSAVPADDVTRHTGAGRIKRVRMRPMSLFETGLSTGEVGLNSLFESPVGYVEQSPVNLADLVETACRGGWPASIGLDVVAAQAYATSYLDEVCRADIPQLGASRSPVRLRRLLRSLARNTASEVSQRTLATDVGGEMPLDPRTVAAYLDALARVYVTEDLPAWSTALRSRASLRQTPKRHLADPSLAAAALDAGPAQLLGDLETFGLLFESLVIRDLRVYAQAFGGQLAHYRDSNGLEVDAIVERRDGSWLAIEIKLGGESAIAHAARTLLKLRNTVDTASAGSPDALAVITAVGNGYRRRDGVAVIPVTALGP
ncbi:ATP-binding protein [Candidatus Poriferisodalis sp.]|uniref:ATP-binding protein n=1 Tax=Candidatus Poriferisodalis sp. TaxID=3101277 RepID=UPI003B01181E